MAVTTIEGRTFAKTFPPYVFSRRGALLHKLVEVELHWYQPVSNAPNARLEKPKALGRTACGMTFFLAYGGDTKKRAHGQTCVLPKPDAVLCGRCNGDQPTFRRGPNRTPAVTWRDAKAKLGCVAPEAEP